MSISINLIEQLEASGFITIKTNKDVASLKDLLVQFIEDNDNQLQQIPILKEESKQFSVEKDDPIYPEFRKAVERGKKRAKLFKSPLILSFFPASPVTTRQVTSAEYSIPLDSALWDVEERIVDC